MRKARRQRPWLVALALGVSVAPAAWGQSASKPGVVVEGGTEVVRPGLEPPPALPGTAAQAGSRTLITRDQFQDTQRTAADVLETVPGVTITRTGGGAAPAKVTLRGSRTDQVLVVIDGVPQSNETDHPAEGRATGRQGVDLAALDLSQVESIEVVRGAASSLYGPGAAGGAVLIRTRRPQRREVLAERTEGSGGYHDTVAQWSEPLGATFPDATVTVRARYLDAQGTYAYYAGKDAGPENRCSEDLGGGYRLRKCNERQIANLSVALLRGERERYRLEWESSDRHGLGGVEDPRPFGRDRQQRVTLDYADGKRVGDDFDLGWTAVARRITGQRTENETLSSGTLENHHTDDFASGELWGDRWFGRHQVRLGGLVSQQTVRDEFRAPHRDQGSLYSRWADHLERGALDASVRFDGYSDVSAQGTYRVAASHRVLGGFGLKASQGTGYRPPSLYELYDPGSPAGLSAANPNLRPEQSTSADGGVFFEVTDRFYGEAIAFRQEYRDNIVAIANPASPSLFRFENLTRTRSTGVEASAQVRPTPQWTLQASGTQTTAILLDNDAVDPRDNGKRVPGIPEARATAEVRWRRESWSVYGKGRYSSARYVDTANTRRLGGYHVYDAGLGFPLPGGFGGGFEARNLLNATYAEQENYPAPGREVFLTVRWRWKEEIPGAPPAVPTHAAPGR
jgi:vitamin B12 transporter